MEVTIVLTDSQVGQIAERVAEIMRGAKSINEAPPPPPPDVGETEIAAWMKGAPASQALADVLKQAVFGLGTCTPTQINTYLASGASGYLPLDPPAYGWRWIGGGWLGPLVDNSGIEWDRTTGRFRQGPGTGRLLVPLYAGPAPTPAPDDAPVVQPGPPKKPPVPAPVPAPVLTPGTSGSIPFVTVGKPGQFQARWDMPCPAGTPGTVTMPATGHTVSLPIRPGAPDGEGSFGYLERVHRQIGDANDAIIPGGTAGIVISGWEATTDALGLRNTPALAAWPIVADALLNHEAYFKTSDEKRAADKAAWDRAYQEMQRSVQPPPAAPPPDDEVVAIT